jgi:hypothetical protein
MAPPPIPIGRGKHSIGLESAMLENLRHTMIRISLCARLPSRSKQGANPAAEIYTMAH